VPDKSGQWSRAFSFKETSLDVVAGQPQLVTVPLTIPVVVIRAQVRNRFGEPITHYTGSWSGSRWSLQHDLDTSYLGEKEMIDLRVDLNGVDARTRSWHTFTRFFPLGQVTDVALTVPIP
jgi:hypothetical protein